MGMLWIWTQDINQNLWYARNEVAYSKLEDFERELSEVGAWNVHKYFLHFVAFFWVELLLLIEVNNEKVWVDNEKALELKEFFHISACFQCRNIIQKYIVAWSRQAFWFKLNFLLPKNESVWNILVYFLEQFQRFSRGLQPLENL